MKCFERIVVTVLKDQIKSFLDPFQFVYMVRRGTKDANKITHLVNSHLEDFQAHICLLFTDFSPAFNTLQPKILIKKLIELKVNPFCIKQFYSFLSNRIQQFRVNDSYPEVKKKKNVSIQGPRRVVHGKYMAVHGNIIEQVFLYKYLGVYMDNSLCWSSHINSLCSRLQ